MVLGPHLDEVIEVEEVVVSATRTVKPLKRIPVITRVMTPKQIEQMAPRSVVDILEMAIPGIQINQHGGQERMVIQGLSADYTLFLVDGERLSSEGTGAVDLHRIDPASVERVEIIQGAASALYGSNAIGGVVNIITRDPVRPVEATLTGLYDTQGIQQYNALVGVNSSGFCSVSRGGWNVMKTYGIPLTESEGEVKVPGNDKWHVDQRFSYINDTLRVRADLGGGYNNRTQAYDTKVKYLYGGYTADARLRYTPIRGYALDFSYHLDGYTRDKYYFTAKVDPIEPVFGFLTHTTRAQLATEREERFRPTFVAGLEMINEGLRSDRFEEADRFYKANTYSLYGQCDWELFARFTMTAGLRQDIHSMFSTHITPRASLMYRGDWWALRLSYSEGFRSPTLKELYMSWDHRGMFHIMGNKQLKPEKSRLIALAPEFTFSVVNFTLIGSYNMMSSKIFLRAEDGGLILRYVNEEEAVALWTAQALLRLRLPFGLSANINYAYIYDYVPGADSEGNTLNLSSTRPHNLTGMLSYEWKYRKYRLAVDFSGRYSGPLVTGIYNSRLDAYERADYEGYAIFRLGVTQRLTRHVSLTLGCDNLFNYVPKLLDVSSSLSPGRSYFTRLVFNY